VALIGETPYGVLPVGGGDKAPPDADAIRADAEAAEAWWRSASFGHWWPRATVLPPVRLATDPAAWCAGGGMGVGPRNAPGLVRAALLALPGGTPCPEHVVLVVAGPVAPHAWRVSEGGVAVAPGRWVRRYAALPSGAGLGAWVHEHAHLLLDWPDLPTSPCLMGQGAWRRGGPAPPCPTLRLAAGWLTLIPAAAALPATALAANVAMSLDWFGRQVLITRNGAEFAIHDRQRPGPPLACGTFADIAKPLLAGVASALAGIDAPGARSGA